MDTDESQSNSNSPPYVCGVPDATRMIADRLIHVLPFTPINGTPSINEINGNINGKPASVNNNNNNNNNNGNNDDQDVSNMVHSDLSKNYSSHNSHNNNSNLSKNSPPIYVSSGDHATNSRYPSVHTKMPHHVSRSSNSGHQVSPQCTSGSINTPPPPPPCLFMIQSTAGTSELLNHPHGSALTAGVVLASMPPVTAGVPQNVSGVNIPPLHQYGLATGKRKTSAFNFMPIDASVLTSSSHSQSLPSTQHQHHHHQAVSVHNSPQQPSTPTPNMPLAGPSEMGPIHTGSCSIVTPSVIRGSVTQGGPGSVPTVTLPPPPLSATASTGPIVVRNRDEKRRATHNEVERRRRDKINSWIMKLSKLVPDCNSDQTKQGQVSCNCILFYLCNDVSLGMVVIYSSSSS